MVQLCAQSREDSAQIAALDTEYERLRAQGPDFTGYHTGSEFQSRQRIASRARIASRYSCSSMAFAPGSISTAGRNAAKP